MAETPNQDLSAASETSLMAVYIRAMESQRPDALIKDEKAVALVAQMSDEFARFEKIPMSDTLKAMRNLSTREYDRYAQDFLKRHPEGVVVHIGCGLDSRFDRVDNGQVEWYDLDLPEVIELRRKLFGDEGERHHLLGCSVLEEAWMEAVSPHLNRPYLFLAEVVLVYFDEAQVKSLVLRLLDHFPGAELVFDACSPLHVWIANRQTASTQLSVHLQWGIWHGQEMEKWGNASPIDAGIRLLDEWGFFDPPEPRLDRIRWLRPLESLIRTSRIYHFRLGEAAG